MTTAHLAIAQQVQALLEAGTPVAPAIKLGRAVPMQLASDTAVFVRLVRSPGKDITANGKGHMAWQTWIGVECVARASAGQDAHAAVDALLRDSFARLAVASAEDGVLNGLTHQCEVSWDTAEAETPIATALLALRVQHLTGPASLVALN